MSIEDFVRRGRSAQDSVNAIIAAATLTKRQAEILRAMRDAPEGSDESELVCDGGHTVWLGLDRVAKRTLFAFLRMAAISGDGLAASNDVERYHLNETGRAILARHEGKNDAR